MTKKLIISADDFGMSKEITDGIITSHIEGIVTSTSLMVNMPDTKRAVLLALQIPSLDVGIHLNITQGRPILPPKKVTTLVNCSGEFLSDTELIPKIKQFKTNPYEIEAEFSAQVDKMLEMGIRPSHLNSHHHVHIYPISAWPFKRVAERFKIKKARFSRYYLIYGLNTNSLKTRLKYYKKHVSITLKNIYKLIIKRIFWNRMIFPDYGVSVGLLWLPSNSFDFQEKWVRLLHFTPNGTFEASCHPGYESTNSIDTDPYFKRRKQELDALTSLAVKETIAKSNITLISFRELN